MYLLHVSCEERSVFDSSGRLMGNLKTRQLLPINSKWNPEVFVHYRKTKDQYDPGLFGRILEPTVSTEIITSLLVLVTKMASGLHVLSDACKQSLNQLFDDHWFGG